ncbi:MAG TPA: hypothetical protein VLF20_04045 [Patescibacteria group bacterium]|nr:hypothetical protein [Patescibacteria group bacterium]
MIILLHIIIAFSSIIYSGYVMLSPSKKKINISFALIAATFITGTYLIVTMPAHLIQACIEGLAYLGVVTILTVVAHKKLAAQRAE